MAWEGCEQCDRIRKLLLAAKVAADEAMKIVDSPNHDIVDLAKAYFHNGAAKANLEIAATLIKIHLDEKKKG